MAGVPKEKATEEGVKLPALKGGGSALWQCFAAGSKPVKIYLETIAELRKIEGVHGVHIMAIEWEEVVGEIVEAAGLMPRP